MVDNARNLDVAMSKYNLIEHSNDYKKIRGRLQQHNKDDPNDNWTDSESFQFK